MQTYSNHIRYYPLHHFVITPLSLVFLSWSIYNLAEAYVDRSDLSFYIYLLVGAIILFLIPVIARIYALKNQNRIIRLEMRLRYFQLTGKSFSEMEKKLSLSQLIALRFAGDGELVPLMEKAIDQNLKALSIKKAITDWQGDYLRV
ncbi:DUF6526 family protein [Lunatibacter salilacus]|uniref:DUF6526 family protein n=1 Tax=Lunatibacter salilacus TaxID=2483804 RepID=UPI00131B6537|nr:DUF6526 family protein [Lunatibacter salilacus]